MKKAFPVKINRLNPSTTTGLTSNDVSERTAAGLINTGTQVKTKSIAEIIFDNTFTVFNLVVMVLGLMVFAVHEYKNMLFIGPMLVNIVIGIVQEIRSKIAIDKLSIMAETKANVIRDGKLSQISPSELVLDDIMSVKTGAQIIADSIVKSGRCMVNEALITGESDPIEKESGDMLMSGSFVISGTCLAQVEHVGDENFATKITIDAKAHKNSNSRIMNSINFIMKALAIAIIPLGGLIYLRQYSLFEGDIAKSVVAAVAALVGMVPEGLVLLTSSVFALSVVNLFKYKVMIRELYSVEALARVDVLCLDKTGTITEGRMELFKTEILSGVPNEVRIAISEYCRSLDDQSPTFAAVASKFSENAGWECTKTVPFTSERKWSGASFYGQGTYVMGAPEILLPNMDKELKTVISNYLTKYRVLLFAHFDNILTENLSKDITPLALLVISDVVRKEAPETLEYFARQGVIIKVISGDNPETVSAVARRAGVLGAENPVDARSLKTDADILQAVEHYSVFGRVTPAQKKQMVKALKQNGHTVAMTGDGINDVLALREADCGIAVASGSDAARNVSTIVLLDDNFAAMPKVVEEGRRSINNLQRSASLFLNKTIFSALLTLLTVIFAWEYPFVPIQLTLVGFLCTSLPSVVLAFEPNKDRVSGDFLKNVLKRSAPAALCVVLSVVFAKVFGPGMGFSDGDIGMLCVFMTIFSGLLLVISISRPFTLLRKLLFGFIMLSLIVSFAFFGDFFSLYTGEITGRFILLLVSMCIAAVAVFEILKSIAQKIK